MLIAGLSRAIVATRAGSSTSGVLCRFEYVPVLTALISTDKAVRLCWPTTDNERKLWPLHLLLHGDFGGGLFSFPYYGLQEHIASQGFAVAFPLSCAWSPFECNGGNGAFVDVLQLLCWFEAQSDHWWHRVIDSRVPYTATGHSTGGRAVLMLAALRDSPEYLANSPELTGQITSKHRAALQKLVAVAGYHADDMLLPSYNPDVEGYRTTATAVFILTGSRDTIEPNRSGWHDFAALETPDKIFVDVQGAGHLAPLHPAAHLAAPFLAAFAKCFALREETSCELLFGSGPRAMASVLHVASGADPNQAGSAADVGLAACRHGELRAIVLASRRGAAAHGASMNASSRRSMERELCGPALSGIERHRPIANTLV